MHSDWHSVKPILIWQMKRAEQQNRKKAKPSNINMFNNNKQNNNKQTTTTQEITI